LNYQVKKEKSSTSVEKKRDQGPRCSKKSPLAFKEEKTIHSRLESGEKGNGQKRKSGVCTEGGEKRK